VNLCHKLLNPWGKAGCHIAALIEDMTALTKSEMADRLHERLGLEQARGEGAGRTVFRRDSICLENNEQVKLSGLAILICAISGSARVATLRPEKKSLSLPAAS